MTPDAISTAPVEPTIDRNLYSGSDWLKAWPKEVVPELEIVADLLGWVYQGLYHLRESVIRADWTNPRYVEVTLWDGGLSTYDNSYLTRLVVACHDLAVRMEILAARDRIIRLRFHPRTRLGTVPPYDNHPTIEDQIVRMRGEQ